MFTSFGVALNSFGLDLDHHRVCVSYIFFIDHRVELLGWEKDEQTCAILSTQTGNHNAFRLLLFLLFQPEYSFLFALV